MNLTKNIGKIYTLSLIGLVVSVLVRIYSSNYLVSDNNHLNDLFVRKDGLQKEISRLTYVENSISSLSVLENRAYSLGFVKMTNTLLGLDITTSSAIAYNISN